MATTKKTAQKGTEKTNKVTATSGNSANARVNNTPVMVKKADRFAERATEKAVNKLSHQRVNKTWRGHELSTACRVDALRQGLTLDECVNNIINILNRADKGKAPEVFNTLTSAGVSIATAKAAAKAVDTSVYAKYINSRGMFDAARAVGALVAGIEKERSKGAKERNAQKK